MTKAKSLYILIAVLLLSSLVIIVSAHPGRTDGSGGHTDHDTGEYHYHHGYPAHDHYDMDGDGDLDCPYNFDDKTDHSPGSNSSSGVNNNAGITADSYENNDANLEEEVKEVPEWVYWSLGVMALVILHLLIANKWKNDEINQLQETYHRDIKKEQELGTQRLQQMEQDHKKQLKSQQLTHAAIMKKKEQSVREGLQNLTSDLSYFYSFNYLCQLSGASENDFIGKDGLPKSGNCEKHKWGEKYTFYTTSRPSASKSKFHRVGCQYCSFCHPINAYTIQKHYALYAPCSVCNPELPNTKWVDFYLEHKKFLDEHMGSEKSRIYDERPSDISYLSKESI